MDGDGEPPSGRGWRWRGLPGDPDGGGDGPRDTQKSRARRAAARAAATRVVVTDLPPDALAHVLFRLPLAHDIGSAMLVNHAFLDAGRLAFKARPYTGEVVEVAQHSRTVRCVAAAPDGHIFTGEDGEGGQGAAYLRVFRGGVLEHGVYAHDIAVLPDGARFITSSDDGFAKLWNADGTLERAFEVGFMMESVAVLPDGVHFVVGTDQDGDLLLYHIDGTLVFTFEGHTDIVLAVVVTRDGQHIISSGFDNLVNVWSVATKSLVSTCTGHTDVVRAVAEMPDGQRILSGSDDATVRVWLLDGTLENTFSELHTGAARALVALPDNQHALSGSLVLDFTVKLFNVNDGAVLRTFLHHTGGVFCLTLLPDGLRFVSGSDDNTAKIVEHGLAFAPARPPTSWARRLESSVRRRRSSASRKS